MFNRLFLRQQRAGYVYSCPGAWPEMQGKMQLSHLDTLPKLIHSLVRIKMDYMINEGVWHAGLFGLKMSLLSWFSFTGCWCCTSLNQTSVWSHIKCSVRPRCIHTLFIYCVRMSINSKDQGGSNANGRFGRKPASTYFTMSHKPVDGLQVTNQTGFYLRGRC